MSRAYRKKNVASFESIIQKGLTALLLTLEQYVEKDIELERIVRVALFLRYSGAFRCNHIFQEILKNCILKQKEDGGWIGVEDSVWSTAFLKEFEEYFQEYRSGWHWLKQQELKSGGWGRSIRDVGRIPLTGSLLFLLPDLSNTNNLEWLKNAWENDYCLNPKLTYKGALFLMALSRCDYQSAGDLVNRTLIWLASQQNEDFGWGPFKGHPVGSSPFCTGVALTGLLQYPEKVDLNVVSKGLTWIQENQLKNGLWADHYIEEGSAWCFYALTEGYRFLKSHP